MAELTQTFAPIGIIGFNASATLTTLPRAAAVPQQFEPIGIIGFNANATLTILPRAAAVPQQFEPIEIKNFRGISTSFFGYRLWMSKNFSHRYLYYCPYVR
jgi:hypothetical protein